MKTDRNEIVGFHVFEVGGGYIVLITLGVRVRGRYLSKEEKGDFWGFSIREKGIRTG